MDLGHCHCESGLKNQVSKATCSWSDTVLVLYSNIKEKKDIVSSFFMLKPRLLHVHVHICKPMKMGVQGDKPFYTLKNIN